MRSEAELAFKHGGAELALELGASIHAAVGDVFYHDCPAGTIEYANANLCPQAILPQETVAPLGAAYASVNRSYIRCTDDRTIPPEFQVTMTADWPAATVYDIPTGHSPFFANPAGLADLLDQIAKG